MSNIDSKDTSDVRWMRWIARLVSIVWAYVTLAIVLFVAAVGIEESKPMAFLITLVVSAIVLTLGAAILASVWKVEAVGGIVLLADCVLIFAWCAVVPQFPPELMLPLMIPPLLAGCLFLVCHKKSRMRGAVQAEQ